MSLNFFDQFSSPIHIGVPLALLAFILPWLLLPSPTPRWVSSRLLTVQNHTLFQLASKLFAPVNVSAHKWAALFVSLLVTLALLNILGLLPYTFTPTTQLSMNLALAYPLWLATVLIGLRNRPTDTFGHLLPEGTPTPLIPALVVIETISLLIRPLALGVRITANLTAGHLLVQLISTAAFKMIFFMAHLSYLLAGLLFLLTLLEVAVAIIQAYVFVLLLTLYLQETA